MTNVKITELFVENPVTTLAATDQILLAVDVGGTPDSGVIQKSDLFAQIDDELGTPTVGGNYKLVASISSNDLVLALKNLDGADFSAAAPLIIKLNDVSVTISAALSVTKADATNWADLGGAELATQTVDLFAYLINETGASAGVKLGWSRIPYGGTVGDFSSTTTNQFYLAGPTNYNATDVVQNIGRFSAILSAGAGYTWTLPAAQDIKNETWHNTRVSTWVPVHTRSGTNYTNAPTTNLARYYISDRIISLLEVHTQNGTPGGTNFQRFTLPFTNTSTRAPIVLSSNNTTAVQMSSYWIASQKYLEMYKYDGTAEATASQVYLTSGTLMLAP